MKKQIPRIGRFILANLAVAGIEVGIMVVVSMFWGSGIEEAADNRALSDLIITGFATLSLGFPFYFLYFLKDDEYKSHYLSEAAEEKTWKQALISHLKAFGKYDLISLLVVSVPIAVIPEVIMGKTGLSFLFFSASLFIVNMPVQILAVLCWDIYVALVYIICVPLAQRKWKKGRIHRPL
jgi:hypothetical protein